MVETFFWSAFWSNFTSSWMWICFVVVGAATNLEMSSCTDTRRLNISCIVNLMDTWVINSTRVQKNHDHTPHPYMHFISKECSSTSRLCSFLLFDSKVLQIPSKVVAVVRTVSLCLSAFHNVHTSNHNMG